MALKTWRLILDRTPLPGALNMAIDEVLFRSLDEEPRTVLRFYRWVRPTASLGYSQPAEKVLDIDFCRRNGIDIVRRITGGKLVLHHREITYSLVSSDTEIFSTGLRESYRLISLGLIRGLAKMGLEARLAGPAPEAYGRSGMICFAYPARDEVEIHGRKIIGSAQKRVGGRFVQHGSIPLQSDEGLLQRVSLLREESSEMRMISLAEALGRPVDFEWAVARLAEGVAEFFGVNLRAQPLTAEESAAAAELQKGKYETEDWTLRPRGAS